MTHQNKFRVEDFNCEIIEWDIKSANTSICREYGLLSEKTLDKLDAMNKDKRERSVGLISQKDKVFAKNLEKKFDEVMQQFILQNELDIDWDILSIRKDAAFIINREIRKPTVGTFVNFRPKGQYTAHLFLKPYDIYIGYEDIDVKGIGDELLPLHKDGILDLFRMIADMKGSSSKTEINKLLSEFVLLYKQKELDFDYYREFNPNSKFRLNLMGNEVLMDYIDDRLLENIDIGYNYENIILPLIRLVR